eukprot:1140428-Pelagomonas_calceolata.AAC.5
MTNTEQQNHKASRPANEHALDTEQAHVYTSPIHLIHTPTQTNVLPSIQNINPEGNDTLNTPLGDGSTISANSPGIQRENPKDGPASKRTCSTKKQESRNAMQQCSRDTSEPSVNQRNTQPETP